MKKLFNKAVLNGTTVVGDGLTYPRIPNVYTGDNEGGYQRGDMMDANAVVEMIKELTDTGEITIDELLNLINEEIQERVEGDQDQQRYTDEKIKNLIGTSPETLDTLKEIADALGEDPDFAANVWNKIAELTTKHDADIKELQDAITSGFENIDFTPYVKKTDVVTDTTNGLMLTSDKVKLDAFEDAEQYANALNLPDYTISNADISSDANNVTIKYTRDNLIGGGSSEVNLLIPAATFNAAGIMSSQDKKKVYYIPDDIITDLTYQKTSSSPYDVAIGIIKKSMSDGLHRNHKLVLLSADQSKAGVMSAYDKQKLDSLVNYQAGNGIDITGDTISCTLDTSLYSIVTELPETGLPNKIYLLPSTETEEGNIYTEYGYVDNKWEELGKYKADVDLSSYKKALNLPNDVISHIRANAGENYVNVYSYKQDLTNGRLSEVSEFDIPKASSNQAGIITAQDKINLDNTVSGLTNEISRATAKEEEIENTIKNLRYINLLDISNNKAAFYIRSYKNNTSTNIMDLLIPMASTSKCGMMTAYDKQKLDSINVDSLATKTDIDDRIQAVVGAAPEALDTLEEIANKLNEDGDAIAAINGVLEEKANSNDVYNKEEVDNKFDTTITGINLAGYSADETINLTPTDRVVTIPLATPTTQGLMDVGDRTFIDNIGQKLVNEGWVQANIGGQGPGIFLTNKRYTGERPYSMQYVYSTVNGQGEVLEQTVDDIIPYATSEQGGMMAKADKTKLDSLKNYTLPAATSTTLGGVKVPEEANIIHLDSEGNINANIALEYNKANKSIRLFDTNGDTVSSIDCTDFIKDGMLDSANVEVNPEGQEAGTYIKLVFNSDAGKDPIYINVSDLIHEYTAGDGINIEGNIINTNPISIKTKQSSFFSVGPQSASEYIGTTIYDNNYISGTKYGIAFNKEEFKYITTTPETNGVSAVCFGLTNNIRNAIDRISSKQDEITLRDNSYLIFTYGGPATFLDLKSDIKASIDSISNKQDALTEGQLNNINNAITSISVNNVEQVNTNGAVNLTIPTVSSTSSGLMNCEDKIKLDGIVDWDDNNAGLLPEYNGDGSDGEWIYTHWTAASQGTDNTWRKASDIILENITSDAILNNTPNATTSKAGLMSVNDKHKLENPLFYYYRNSGYDTLISHTTTGESICYNGSAVLEILGEKVEFKGVKICTYNGTPYIDCSTSTAVASLLDGLMSKEDKAKLDSQPTIKANDATGVTDDDYVVIKKSELDSILSRLTALENKA